MNCSKIMDLVYEYSGNNHRAALEMPLFLQIRVGLHTLTCQNCARQIELFKKTRNILSTDFFPPSPNMEDSIMAKLYFEETENEKQSESACAFPGGLHTRGWIIAGIVIMVSLVTAFFGLDFQYIANESGMSFMLPMGMTIGIALTVYGVFFIGSHLKELSERFGL
ncbi:MAG: peptidoglycan-binding protein [Treponema sp.]|nr:peptidoglycan-binding protein [Treponema sp.]